MLKKIAIIFIFTLSVSIVCYSQGNWDATTDSSSPVIVIENDNNERFTQSILEIDESEDVIIQGIPSREQIRSYILQEKYMIAQKLYISWANAWKDEDPKLFLEIAIPYLTRLVNQGDVNALVALLYTKNSDALFFMRQVIREGEDSETLRSVGFTTNDLPALLYAFGKAGTKSDALLLLPWLKSENNNTVNLAIETLGDLGNRDVWNNLFELAGTADFNRSVIIANTARKLDIEALKDHYKYQYTHFPTWDYVTRRAAILLAVSGNMESWSTIKDVLDKKDPKFYPAVLGALGNIYIEDTMPYVVNALNGSAAEQRAAANSMNAINTEILFGMVKDSDLPEYQRQKALAAIAGRGDQEVLDYIYDICVDPSEDELRVLTVQALQLADLLGLYNNRVLFLMSRAQIDNEDERVAVAAKAIAAKYIVYYR